MSAAREWLSRRLGDAPPELLQSMIEAVPDTSDLGVPRALALGALDLYSRVANGSGGREDALPLLAADALFTHAFEAQAMVDPGGLKAFAGEFGATGELGRIGVA